MTKIDVLHSDLLAQRSPSHSSRNQLVLANDCFTVHKHAETLFEGEIAVFAHLPLFLQCFKHSPEFESSQFIECRMFKHCPPPVPRADRSSRRRGCFRE